MTGRTAIRVRYAETDTMGVVHHANYIIYFEVARTEFMRERGVSYAEMERDGVRLAVVEVSVRYRARALFDDLIEVETTLGEVRGVRISFGYRIYRNDEGERTLVCEGSTELACIDPAGRPMRFPQKWREALERARSV